MDSSTSTESIKRSIERLKKLLKLNQVETFTPEDYFIMGFISGANYGNITEIDKIQQLLQESKPQNQNNNNINTNSLKIQQQQSQNGVQNHEEPKKFNQEIDNLSQKTENLDDSDISFQNLNLAQRRIDHEKQKQSRIIEHSLINKYSPNSKIPPQQQEDPQEEEEESKIDQNQYQNQENQQNNLFQENEYYQQQPQQIQKEKFFHNNNDILDQGEDMDEINKMIQEQKANEALIQQLLQEDQERIRQDQEGRQKQEMGEQTCAICLDDLFNEEELAYMENCEHIYHADCFKEHLKVVIKSRDNAKIICPGDGCKSQVIVDAYQNLLSDQEYQEYQQYSLQNYVDTHGDEYSWCPTADCDYVFVLEDDESQNNFVCPKCKKHYCLSCRVVYHKGQSCKEYKVTNTKDENDEKFEKYIKGKKFKQCGKCKAIVSKTQGCDHMTCRCGYQFCYKCGGKYMHCECIQQQRERQEQLRQQQLARRNNANNRRASRGGRKRGRR